MFKRSLTVGFIALSFINFGQSSNWQAFTDSIPSLSSPRACDLNGDGIKDIVIGGGTDGVFSNNGIMAYNGLNGNLLWKRASRNEVFGSGIFQDITGDGVKDVFIPGRQAQLLAINGSNGTLIWDYFPYGTNPADSGLYNFYNPQFIQDVNGDNVQDILVSNGGDHNAPAWQTNRPPGHLMVVNGLNGSLLAKAVVPDSAETYCSPIVADIQNNGTKWILYGTGGENLGGSFFACPLNDLIQNNSLANSITLATNPNKGYIAPATVEKDGQNAFDIYIQCFDGAITKIKGSSFGTVWTTTIPNTESSAALVLGKFNADFSPDVFAVLFKGVAPSYTDFYQVVLNGDNGNIEYFDSLGTMHYASANAVDIDNNGIDEAVVSVTYFENGAYKHRMHALDFYNNTTTQMDITRSGVNLGCTPLIENIDSDPQLEMIYVVKKDSINPVGWKGIFVNCVNTSFSTPNSGIAWGSYMGTQNNGYYNYTPINCGFGSLVQGVNFTHPTCNGLTNGTITPVLFGNSGPYTYVWSNGSINPSISGLGASSYTVRVTNAQGCYEDRSTLLMDPYVISFGGIAAPTCPGGNNGTATLNSSGCYCMFSTCTFLWENGGTAKPNYNLVEGWNSVTINHPDGCTVVDSVFIPSPPPVIDSFLVKNLSCFNTNDGMIELYPYQPVSNVNFAWSTGMSADSIYNLWAGTFSVIVEDSRPCIDTLTFTITQPDSLIFATNVNHVNCYNGNDGTIDFSANGGTTPYSYYLNNLQSQNPVLSDLIAGNYTVNVSDSNGCFGASQNITISQPSELILNLSGTPSSGLASFDGIASVATSGGTAPYSYLWNDSNSQTDSMAVYLNPGWYEVLVTDNNGCSMTDSIYLGATATDELNNYPISLFPNPTNNFVRISVSEDMIGLNCKLITFNGSLLEEVILKTLQTDIDLSEYALGIYYIQIGNRNNTKLVKL
jgi:hypothetical protein